MYNKIFNYNFQTLKLIIIKLRRNFEINKLLLAKKKKIIFEKKTTEKLNSTQFPECFQV